MSNTRKLALSAVLTSGSVVLIWAAGLVPTGSLALVALVGIITGIVVLECGYSWGIMQYVAVAALSFFVNPDIGVTAFYAVCVGWYPIVKIAVERKVRGRLRLTVAKVAVMAMAIAGYGIAATLLFRELLTATMETVMMRMREFANVPEFAVYALVAVVAVAVYLVYDHAVGLVLAEFSRRRSQAGRGKS
ncbi:MAG: hypothetical protein LBC65_00305 [Oscillospiraceae bacterium]|jgi:hypothetical protein|nr:hypothetical protein [Oscillospiraceae bacterium]